MLRIGKLLPLLLLCCLPCRAATINASSCSQANVQSALNTANPGDTVVIPGGSASWNTAISIPQSVILNMNGCSVTTTIQHTVVLDIDGTLPTVIENGSISCGCQAILIDTYGAGAGLIASMTLTGGGASELIHNLGYGAGVTTGWSNDVTPGSRGMLYVENNTFNDTDSTFLCSGIQSYYGARTVIRHNTFNFCQIDQHGTAGAVGARWWEAYDNVFNAQGHNQCCYIEMRAGSGVIFGNTTAGTNTGTGGIQLTEEDSGYPALYQIGRGISQKLSPAYVWGNGAIIVGPGSSNVQEGRDYFLSTSQPSVLSRCQLSTDVCTTSTVTTTYSYAPYTYPYPIGGTPPPPPAPPTGLKVIILQ